jgi:hypothetical protein
MYNSTRLFTLLNKQVLLHTCVLSWCLFQYISSAFYLIMLCTAQNYGIIRQQWIDKAVERRVCVLLSGSYISTWSLRLRKNTNKFKPRVSLYQLRNETGTFSIQVRSINLRTKWPNINTTVLTLLTYKQKCHFEINVCNSILIHVLELCIIQSDTPAGTVHHPFFYPPSTSNISNIRALMSGFWYIN